MYYTICLIICKYGYFKTKIVNNVCFLCITISVPESPQVAMQQYRLSPL